MSKLWALVWSNPFLDIILPLAIGLPLVSLLSHFPHRSSAEDGLLLQAGLREWPPLPSASLYLAVF